MKGLRKDVLYKSTDYKKAGVAILKQTIQMSKPGVLSEIKK